MAFTGSPTSSVQRALQKGGGGGKVEQHDFSRMMVAEFYYKHAAGQGVGEINLIKLPSGKIRIYPNLCEIITSPTFTATVDLHIGYRAYTDPEASTPAVIADDNYFADNLDPATVLKQSWPLPLIHPVFNTRDGFEIFIMLDTSTGLEDDDVIEGCVVYSRGG